MEHILLNNNKCPGLRLRYWTTASHLGGKRRTCYRYE